MYRKSAKIDAQKAPSMRAAYLVELARSSKGGRYRKSAKIDALRQYKEEIWRRIARPLSRL